MPNKKRYWECKLSGICTECEHRKATRCTRCDKCFEYNHNRKRYGKPRLDSASVKRIKEVWAACDNRCAICKQQTKLVTDHCHKLNKFRGYLCQHCNSGLGFFRDNIEWLLQAAIYLDEFGKSQ